MVCGCGAQGSTICFKLDQEPGVEQIICANRTFSTAEALCKRMTKGIPKQVDGTNIEDIKSAAAGCDLIINALPIQLSFNVLKAAIELGCCYQDLGACEDIPEVMHINQSDRWIEGVKCMYDIYSKKFAENNSTALIATGSSPGLILVMARKCVELLDECDTINLMVYEGIEAKRFLPFWWSPDVALLDMSDDGFALENCQIIHTKPFSRKIIRKWAEMDNQPVTLCEHSHDEPVHIGLNREKYFKGCKNAYFKYGGVGIQFS